MATKVNIDPGRVFKAIREVFNDVSTQRKLLLEISDFSAKRIQAFARIGKTLVSGKPKALPKLSESYRLMRMGALKFRKIDDRVVPFGEPDEKLNQVDSQFFRPTAKRSNLTFTGDLMKAVKGEVKGSKAFVRVNESRGDGKKNSEVIKNLQKIDPGYKFLGLDDKGQQRIRRMVLNELRRKIRLRF